MEKTEKSGVTDGGADETRTRDLRRDRLAFYITILDTIQRQAFPKIRMDNMRTKLVKMAQAIYLIGVTRLQEVIFIHSK